MSKSLPFLLIPVAFALSACGGGSIPQIDSARAGIQAAKVSAADTATTLRGWGQIELMSRQTLAYGDDVCTVNPTQTSVYMKAAPYIAQSGIPYVAVEVLSPATSCPDAPFYAPAPSITEFEVRGIASGNFAVFDSFTGTVRQVATDLNGGMLAYSDWYEPIEQKVGAGSYALDIHNYGNADSVYTELFDAGLSTYYDNVQRYALFIDSVGRRHAVVLKSHADDTGAISLIANTYVGGAGDGKVGGEANWFAGHTVAPTSMKYVESGDGNIWLRFVERDGDRTVAWLSHLDIASGVWGTPVRLPQDPTIHDGLMAIDKAGNTHYVYPDSGGLQHIVYSASQRRWSTPDRVTSTVGAVPMELVALDSNATLLLRWSSAGQQQASYLGGSQWTAVALGVDASAGVAHDGAGNLYTIWINTQASGPDPVLARSYDAASHAWSASVEVSPPDDGHAYDRVNLSIAALPDGRAIASWVRSYKAPVTLIDGYGQPATVTGKYESIETATLR